MHDDYVESVFVVVDVLFILLCRLKINHMMDLQVVRLSLRLARSRTVKLHQKKEFIPSWR